MTTEETTTTATTPQSNGDSSSEPSLMERYHGATESIESAPLEAAQQLEKLQQEIAQLTLFSSNESLEDISTKSLPLLALEHYLAVAYTRLPTAPGGGMKDRRNHLIRSMDLWANFLQKLDAFSRDSTDAEILMSDVERKEYDTLMECTTHNSSSSTGQDNGNNNHTMPVLPAPRREDKIARFKAKQQAQKEVERLRSLRERRARIGVSAEEVMDDYDEETLDRTVAMTNLLVCKANALEEWAATIRELPMIERMVQSQEQQTHVDRHTGGRQQQQLPNGNNNMNDPRQRPKAPNTGLNVTHISLDANNQLQFKKEEIKSQVFRPGWNQPTMSLEEFADRERADAIQREERQNIAEANQAQGPRRYDQLQRDGREDDVDAVDASAALDRAWDDWKDENPRGSGNKHGDRGDRNF